MLGWVKGAFPQPATSRKFPLMSDAVKLAFASLDTPAKGVLVVFTDAELKLGPATGKTLGPAADLVSRAAKSERFKGKNGGVLEIVAPGGLNASRLVVVGTGKAAELKPQDFVKLGGVAMGKIPGAAAEATILAELPSEPLT